MLRRGKRDGWLQLPSAAFLPWTQLNDVGFHRIVPGTVPGRGGALLAKESLDAETDHPRSRFLLTVPRDLILSLERVREHAHVDRDFREVLESLGDFGRTPRGAILSFLLVQASAACPDLLERVSVHSPFVDYVKSLPMEDLPTYWSQAELELLVGTTLGSAVSAKLRSLNRECERFCSSVRRTRWYGIVESHLDFDDWMNVDAMYRSRALELPGVGHCMVPCLDLANHTAGDATIAVYEQDEEGNALLYLRDGKKVAQGEEVTITYGDEKGACEMLFSYGFLEDDRDTAQTLFLSLAVADDDPQRMGKLQIADCAPGFKLVDTGDGEMDWTGEYIWLLCANADDGLRFELARTIDGEGEEMHALFGVDELPRGSDGAATLHRLLAKSARWDVYRLRAVTILQQRVFEQMQVLFGTQDGVESVAHGEGTEVRDGRFSLAMKLRRVEFELMEAAYEQFEGEKIRLAECAVVVDYLSEVAGWRKAT